MGTRFSEVLPLLREGYVARRADWKGVFVFLAGGGRIVDGKSVRSEHTSTEDAACCFLLGGPVDPNTPVAPVLCLSTLSAVVLGHALSMDDLTASDWEARRPALPAT